MSRLIQAKQIDVGAAPFYANTSIPGGNTVVATSPLTETAFNSSFVLPANSLKVGDFFKLYLRGVYGAAAVLPSLRLRIKIGTVVVADTGALTTLLGSSNSGWGIDLNLLCLGLPTSTTPFDVQGNGYTQSSSNLSVAAFALFNTSTFSIDCTKDQTVTVTALWSAVNASNTITLRQFLVRKD